MARGVEGTLIKVDILDSELSSSNEVRIKLGDNASGSGISQSVQPWGSDGFISRPNVKDDKGVCQALMQIEGNTRRAVAYRDGRFNDKYAQLEEGDRAIVTDADVRVLVKKATNGVTIYTKDDNGNVLTFQVDGHTGTITAMVGGTDGTAMLQMKSGSIQMSSGGSAAIVLKGNNVTIHGDLFWAATGRQVIGQIGGLPPPMGSNSALVGPAGQVGVPSTQCTIGP